MINPPQSSFRSLVPILLTCLLGVLLAGLIPRSEAASSGKKPKIVMLIADEHYNTEESLPPFAQKFLAPRFNVVRVQGSSEKLYPRGERTVTFDRIEELADADLMLVSATRRVPEKAQLAAIRKFVAAGKPVVGIRTSNHAFIMSPGNTHASGAEEWREWDAQVIGGNYSGHYRKGVETTVRAAAPTHPILKGVTVPFIFTSQLYKVSPLQPRTQILLVGEQAGEKPEPMAWLHDRPGGGKTFYIAMGGLEDFANPSFTTCLVNAITWLLENRAAQ